MKNWEGATAIAVDDDGNAYLTGYCQELFPVVNAIQPTYGGALQDVFITYLNDTGKDILFSTYLGGFDNEYASDIALDNQKDVYIVGNTSSIDFPTSVNAIQGQLSRSGFKDAFISKFTRPGFLSLTNFYANRINPNDVFLSWDGGSQESYTLTGYELYSSLNSTKKGELNLISTTNETSMVAKGFDANKEYRFGVIATYEGGIKGELVFYDLKAEQLGDDALLYHLRFPHVAQNNQWWTGIVAVNPSDEPITIELKAIDESGKFIKSSPVLLGLNGGQKTVGLANTYFSQEILEKTSWIDLESNGKLLGFELFGQDFDNMSGVMVNGKMLHNGFLPIAEDRNDRYVALSLINVSTTNSSFINFKGYSSSGNLVAQYSKTLLPQTKVVNTVKGLFGVNWSNRIHSLSWEASSPLVGFEIWGDLGNWDYQHGLSIRTSGAIENILPIVEPGSSIVLQNTSNTAINVTLKAYNDSGELWAILPMRIYANQTRSYLSDSLIAKNFSGFVIATSSGAINALVELNRNREDGILAEAIPSQTKNGFNFLFPHIASNTQWSTEIMLINNDIKAQTATITPYDIEGVKLEGMRTSINIAPKGRLYSKIKDIFEQTENISYIRVSTSKKTFVGHLIYYTNEGYGHIMGGIVVKPID